jgi:hypothetical protein
VTLFCGSVIVTVLVLEQPLHGAKLPAPPLWAYDQVIAGIPGPTSVLLVNDHAPKNRPTLVCTQFWPGTPERPCVVMFRVKVPTAPEGCVMVPTAGGLLAQSASLSQPGSPAG